MLWPTELKRRVGKLPASRRYNLIPLLRSHPGGFKGSWPYRTCPCFKKRVQRYYKKVKRVKRKVKSFFILTIFCVKALVICRKMRNFAADKY